VDARTWALGEKYKMKKVLVFLIFCISTLLLSCVTNSPIKKDLFNNLEISFEETENNNLLKVTINGKILDSSLSIESYKIRYEKNKIFIDINRKIQPTGISLEYFIQFYMNKDVKEIYIGNDLFWTSSVESYFKSEELSFPINIQKCIKNTKITLEGESEISESEKKEIQKFIDYFSNNISIEKCKEWNKEAVAFSIYDFGIYEESDGKKYFVVNVKAFYENNRVYDRIIKIQNMDITSLYNLLMFNYETYEEVGWVF